MFKPVQDALNWKYRLFTHAQLPLEVLERDKSYIRNRMCKRGLLDWLLKIWIAMDFAREFCWPISQK